MARGGGRGRHTGEGDTEDLRTDAVDVRPTPPHLAMASRGRWLGVGLSPPKCVGRDLDYESCTDRLARGRSLDDAPRGKKGGNGSQIPFCIPGQRSDTLRIKYRHHSWKALAPGPSGGPFDPPFEAPVVASLIDPVDSYGLPVGPFGERFGAPFVSVSLAVGRGGGVVVGLVENDDAVAGEFLGDNGRRDLRG